MTKKNRIAHTLLRMVITSIIGAFITFITETIWETNGKDKHAKK